MGTLFIVEAIVSGAGGLVGDVGVDAGKTGIFVGGGTGDYLGEPNSK